MVQEVVDKALFIGDWWKPVEGGLSAISSPLNELEEPQPGKTQKLIAKD